MKNASPLWSVLFEDDDILAIRKEPGIPTTSPDEGGDLTTLLRKAFPRPAHMHPSSRLDAEVSGVILFAKTDRAIRGLLEARQRHEYTRVYHAITTTPPNPSEGQWYWDIAIDPSDPRRRVHLPASRTAPHFGNNRRQLAHTHYRTLQDFGPLQLLELQPETGRTHQLRVHAAAAGSSLFGDRHYGGARRATDNVGRVFEAKRTMLHCTRVQVAINGETVIEVDCPYSLDFATLMTRLGR